METPDQHSLSVLEYGTAPRHARLKKWAMAANRIMSRTAWGACIVLLGLLLLWSRSYFRSYAIGYVAESTSEPSYFLWLDAGRFKWCEYQGGDATEGFHLASRPLAFAESRKSWSYGEKESDSDLFWNWEFAGLSYFVPVPPRRPMYPWREITVPLSLCMAGAGIVPLGSILARRRKRARRRAMDLCVRCTHDLRATPEC